MASILHIVLNMKGHNNKTKVWYLDSDGRLLVKTRYGHTSWSRIVIENSRDGKEIRQGFEVHHKDDNHTNDSRENLVVLTKRQHQAHHNQNRRHRRDKT